MLELRNVSKTFNTIAAVDNVSFSARQGEIAGYLGPNGSGKSTAMEMLARTHEADVGCDSVEWRTGRCRREPS
jgi:ABC-type multidrug transport system ATPase subunit